MGANCPGCGELRTSIGPRGDYCSSCGLTQAHAAASGTAPADEEPNARDSTPSQADALIDLGLQAQLCHDPLGVTYARFEVDGHLETWPLDSRYWKSWLSRSHYKQSGKAPSAVAMSAALLSLTGLAQFDGPEFDLHNRVGEYGGAIYYDLTDAAWRAVRIDGNGWQIVDRPPNLFRRYSHQRPQVEPVDGGNIRDVIEFLNIRKEDELLELCELVTDFVPDIPHPIRDVHGEKGAGKSVSQRVRRRLIDPSAAETLAFPRVKEELAQILSHHYAPIFDNIDNIQPALSDMLCRAVTGDGLSKRKLYSDDEDVIYAYRRVLQLNGINVVAQRPDLLDRTILYRLERIPRHQRRSEKEFWRDFEEARPKILGAIFDALSSAMRVQGTLELPAMERMADFTQWGAAVSIALGEGADAFLEAYRDNIIVQTREAVTGHLVGAAILALMVDFDGEWSGTPTQLHTALESVGEREKLIRRSKDGKVFEKDWPKNASALSRKLTEVSSNLADLGIAIEHSHGDENLVTVRRAEVCATENAVGAVGRVGQSRLVADSPDGTDATDGIIGTSSSQALDIEIP